MSAVAVTVALGKLRVRFIPYLRPGNPRSEAVAALDVPNSPSAGALKAAKTRSGGIGVAA
jgi:hypothetical protein